MLTLILRVIRGREGSRTAPPPGSRESQSRLTHGEVLAKVFHGGGFEGMDVVMETLNRLRMKGGPYLVCLCPHGQFNRESRVDVEFKRVECRRCGGWKNEADVCR